MRCLEIGPGPIRLPGFETLNVIKTPVTDHVGPAHQPPFKNNTFDVVYSSHCIEHVEWFLVEDTVKEWARILKPNGLLEVHTVNGYALIKGMMELEIMGETSLSAGKWKQELHKGDPYKWAVGRIMNYKKANDPSNYWQHRAIITPRYLRLCFEQAGLVDIQEVAEPRGPVKHKSVNMGLKGTKRA